MIYLSPIEDSLFVSSDYALTRCVNHLADSLSILISSFQNQVLETTLDSTIIYKYQFTKTLDIEFDFQSKLSEKHECFVIEDKWDVNKLAQQKEFVLYNGNEWLVFKINGIPRIGNSTYITDSYIYFKKEIQ